MLRRIYWLLLLLFCIVPAPLHASGINLSWNDCGNAGDSNKDFACDTNSGVALLVGSFVAPSGVTELVGIQATLDVWTSADSLRSWWQFAPGACRQARLSVGFNFTSGPYTCSDLWGGGATGGFNYAVDSLGATHARLRLVAAVPSNSSLALDADQEYYAFSVSILLQKTTGSGACGGCGDPVSVQLSSLTLAQPAGVGDVTLTEAASDNVATWQGGAGGAYAMRGPYFGQIRSILR